MILKSYFNIISRCCLRTANTKLIQAPKSCCRRPYVQTDNLLSTKCNNILFLPKKTTLRNEEECKIFSKENLISRLNFRCDDDSGPFYKLPIKTLVQIYSTTKKDEELGHCQNRLYYLADSLKCSPSQLSKSVAKRTFIYTLSFDWLERSLATLLNMGVSEDRILRDLWVLKYHSKTIEERLLRVKKMGVENIYPWMVRCSEKILNRSISISQETKKILGEIKSTKIYLANRLNTTPEAVEEMYLTTPALKRIRASKIKKFLDFLIEEGFNVEDIARKPRVISASQKTVMTRLEKLRKLGVKEINLNVLCRSRKDFKKFCESLESASNNISD